MFSSYFNDSLKVRIDFFGDYSFSTLKGKSKYSHKELFLKKCNTPLFIAKSKVDPYIHCLGYLSNKNDSLYYINKGFIKHSINKRNIWEFNKSVIINDEIFLQYIIPLEKSDLYLLATANRSENPQFELAFLDKLLREEYEDIFARIATGKNYMNAPVDNSASN
jgi:hypothetical protein